MYKRDKSIQFKSSASLLYNNLSIYSVPQKNIISYAVVHKSAVNIATSSSDTANVHHREVYCKDAVTNASTALILQAKFCDLPSRSLLVICSQKGLQMFEPDGSAMVFWHALASGETKEGAVFTRGITAVHDNYIAVGASSGVILIFTIPSRGTNITLQEMATAHNCNILDLANEGNVLASADDSGCIMLWKSGPNFQQLLRINGSGMACTSLCMLGHLVIGGYGSGHIRIYSSSTGDLQTEICAHAKWINAIDVAPDSNLLLTSSEDSFVRLWALQTDSKYVKVNHEFSESVTDLQICGAQFLNSSGTSFGVTGYDSNEVVLFSQKC
ncbi:WD repeat-containing protein 54-like [Anneissia japonica]|uniref:WD repeat-containing protein 54-like n=1 Tax=Anneissia japonica TaxID=1529436 RepID=UPI0014258EBE|nr:WD repeat-containing protein 54-like [Anneissia japonica]